MNIQKSISIDLSQHGPTPRVFAVEGDSGTRSVLIQLYDNGEPWIVPEGVSVSIMYEKSDGTSGWYDTLPDGSAAYTINANTILVDLARQMLTVSGNVFAAVVLMDSDQNQLTTLDFLVHVAAVAADSETSEDYYDLQIVGNIRDILARVETLEASGAKDSAMALPSYYDGYLTNKIAQIKTLTDEAGTDGTVFIMFSDSHMGNNNGGNSGKLAYHIMNQCQIPYVLHFGDAGSNSPQETEVLCAETLELFNEMVKPLEGRLLQILGNHDGAWGLPVDTDGDGATDTYPYNMTRAKTYNRAMMKNRLGNTKVFGPDGTYYYMDDFGSRTRFLMLNTSDKPYQINSDGTMVNACNTMKGFAIRQAQVEWIIESLKVPAGWSVITCSHAQLHPDMLDSSGHIRALLAAYRDKTAYSASYAGQYGWDSLDISADFTDYEGSYIAHFCGHAHNDYWYKAASFLIDMVSIACDGRISNCTYMTNAAYSNRDLLTVYEQVLDVVVINKAAGTISTVRIGAGENRIIGYATQTVTYTVTSNLANCAIDNNAASVIAGSGYAATITPYDGFALSGVTVTMGGTDITATAYADGVISIESVTGNIVITATATIIAEPEAVNLWDLSTRTAYTSDDVALGQSSSSQIKAADTRAIFYDKYIKGATSNGNWSFDETQVPNVTVDGDGFALGIVISGVGLGVPVALEAGKSYTISYHASAGHRLYATYFNENGVYTTSTAVVSSDTAGGTFSKTFTVGADAFCQLTFRAGVSTVSFTNIELVEA